MRAPTGVHFAVWAPNARRVSIVGAFNDWDGRRHPMRHRLDTGIWEIFIPDIGEGQPYKYEIIGPDGVRLPLKADPFAFRSELRPATASITASPVRHEWGDEAHRAFWAKADQRREAMSIYEVHAGSWQRRDDGTFLSWDEMADRLIAYVVDTGFTHIEFMPITEHPYDPSWGYQTTGLYAPTARFGDPHGFARFVDGAHRAGIGVILDWVPAHFPVDEHGLAHFDGTALYEHADPRKGFHPDWNTAIYNFGRSEVHSYLVNNALYWAEIFHLDGLRVDAVASMLYLDYSRKAGEWIPNERGGRENLEAVRFLQDMNRVVYGHHPGVVTIAEESTSWPKVSQPVHEGGLGFGFKWNMGFMHDTLEYFAREPIHRKHHHNEITFGLLYAFSENFVLPLSHDEVVHGKGTLLAKMAGDDWQKFANLRAYYAFMWGYPGKKLLFMGQEFAQRERMERGASARLASARPRTASRRARPRARPQLSLPLAPGAACARLRAGRLLLAGRRRQPELGLRLAAQGAGAAARSPSSPISRRSCATTTACRCRRPATWREILNSDAEIYGGSGKGNAGRVDRHGAARAAARLRHCCCRRWRPSCSNSCLTE